MFTLKNVETNFRSVVDHIALRRVPSRTNEHTGSISVEVELVGGQRIGEVVELWVKTVRGFVMAHSACAITSVWNTTCRPIE